MNWEMIGHRWAVGLLQSHIKNDQVRHAYLFTGPAGIGKQTLATHFAQALNCSDPPAVAEYCGQCRACNLIREKVFPDLHIVSTQEHDRTLKVDQIRGLQRKVSLSPYEGKYHVVLLVRFHEATEQAANALLKTLEEPPRQVIMLLTAESSESLLPTIVSRCEVLPLRSLPIHELEGELESHVGDIAKSGLLAGISAGRPGYALTLAHDDAEMELRNARIEELLTVIDSDRINRFEFIERWDRSLRRKFDKLDDRRLECIAVLELWLSFWRDVLLSDLGARDPESNPDKLSEIQEISSGIALDEIVDALRGLERSIEAIHRNANLRLVLETLMINLPHTRIEPA
jgi:DNA polymerase-3 subunit delta'